MNTLNVLSYSGDTYNMTNEAQFGGNDPKRQAALSAAFFKNCAISGLLSSFGHVSFPIDLSQELLSTTPDWNRIASDSRFRAIVSRSPWGVMARLADGQNEFRDPILIVFLNVLSLKQAIHLIRSKIGK